ncbi:hypothetical protein F0562_015288 [Nyssa sinensis]|uniref:DAGKc domain-containing protein n=1 Tax=Nyssa sinensis TaxID=561372 RepID=A0A5J4ZJ19_9ASTE|nr:hypothetical protein F0562_015288 [Nyssa sinensis]
MYRESNNLSFCDSFLEEFLRFFFLCGRCCQQNDGYAEEWEYFQEYFFEIDTPTVSSPLGLVFSNSDWTALHWSGRGRSIKVFHGMVEPIFKLAGFKMEAVKTTSAGHAKNLASNVDFSSCPDGIICVGGDGIVNEVLNGLLSGDNQKEAISIPIGIILASLDNSLVGLF